MIHGDGDYVDGELHVNTCESHGSLLRPWLSLHRGVSKDKLTQHLRAFQLRRELFDNQVEKRSNTLFKPFSEINNVLQMSASRIRTTTRCSVESRDCGGIDRYIGKDEAEEDRYGRSGSPRLHADV